MPSEYNHIDDFFRKKESEIHPDLSMQSAHWKEMQGMMNGTTTNHGRAVSSGRLIWIVSVALVTVIAGTLLYKKANIIGSKHTTASTIPSSSITQLKSGPVDDSFAQGSKSLSITVTPSLHILTKRELHQSQSGSPAAIQNESPLPFLIDSPAMAGAPLTLNLLFEQLKKTREVFSIDASRDTVLQAKEGTSLVIPAHSFITGKGEIVNGMISLSITEFYEMADIIGNKLTTTSANEALVTGGMIHLQAVKGADTLQLAPGGSLRLNMPTKRFDPAMQLFYGTQHPIHEEPASVVYGPDWSPAGQQQLFLDNRRRIIKVLDMADDPRAVIYRKGKRIGKFILSEDAPYTTTEAKSVLKQRYGKWYDEIRVRHGWRTSFLKWNDEIRVSNPYGDGVIGDSIDIDFEEAVNKKFISREDSVAYETKWKKETALQDSISRQYILIKSQYEFRITNLNWINCDRFLASNAPKIDFVADLGDDNRNTFFQGFAIFKNVNGIMPARWSEGKLYFKNLPEKEPVSIVCIGIREGRAWYSISETVVEKQELKIMKFEATDPVEFRKKLRQFGNVQGG